MLLEIFLVLETLDAFILGSMSSLYSVVKSVVIFAASYLLCRAYHLSVWRSVNLFCMALTRVVAKVCFLEQVLM